mgnify:CR=1 FL=1
MNIFTFFSDVKRTEKELISQKIFKSLEEDGEKEILKLEENLLKTIEKIKDRELEEKKILEEIINMIDSYVLIFNQDKKMILCNKKFHRECLEKRDEKKEVTICDIFLKRNKKCEKKCLFFTDLKKCVEEYSIDIKRFIYNYGYTLTGDCFEKKVLELDNDLVSGKFLYTFNEIETGLNGKKEFMYVLILTDVSQFLEMKNEIYKKSFSNDLLTTVSSILIQGGIMYMNMETIMKKITEKFFSDFTLFIEKKDSSKIVNQNEPVFSIKYKYSDNENFEYESMNNFVQSMEFLNDFFFYYNNNNTYVFSKNSTTFNKKFNLIRSIYIPIIFSNYCFGYIVLGYYEKSYHSGNNFFFEIQLNALKDVCNIISSFYAKNYIENLYQYQKNINTSIMSDLKMEYIMIINKEGYIENVSNNVEEIFLMNKKDFIFKNINDISEFSGEFKKTVTEFINSNKELIKFSIYMNKYNIHNVILRKIFDNEQDYKFQLIGYKLDY